MTAIYKEKHLKSIDLFENMRLNYDDEKINFELSLAAGIFL